MVGGQLGAGKLGPALPGAQGAQGANLPLTALGGALVPLAVLPGWAQAAAPASPGYWAMSALRAALRGEAAPTLRAAAILLAVAAVTAGLAAWRISRGWTRSKLL